MIKILGRNKKGLRKQPKYRRVQATSSVATPKIVVPSKAKKRRRRNNSRIRLPVTGLKQALLSARWMSLVLLVTCLWALVTVGRAETFFLTEVTVEGSDGFRQTDLIEASGLVGAHIFGVEPAMAAERINDVPGVLSATVTVQWPNHVTVQVAEEKPLAMWMQAGQSYWVTESGNLVPARGDGNGLLVLQSQVKEPVGENETIPSPVLEGALLLKELRPNINKLYYSPGNGLSYQDGRGWLTHFGTGTDMAQKLVVYEAIIEDLLQRQITPEYISVRNQARPYYMAGSGG